jgi:hypothetical protein
MDSSAPTKKTRRSFEAHVKLIQREAGWSDHTLLGILLDWFWTTKRGNTVAMSVLRHLSGKRDDSLASQKVIEGEANV